MRLSRKEKWIAAVSISIILPFVFISYSSAAKVNKILSSPIAGAEYVGTETCKMCHEEQAREFERSTHAKFAIPEEKSAGQGCESCHGPGSLHTDNGNPTKIVRESAELCFQCHLDKKVEFNLQYHHPVLEGKMNCSTCHDAHGDDVRAWSATSLQGPNEKCFTCHKEQKGPFVWEHEAVREGCQTCHNPHGSTVDKLLVMQPDPLCIRCHYEAAFLTGPTIGQKSHAGYSMGAGERCIDHHREGFHGSNFRRQFKHQ
jgi:predicted CXXCH cytochrome family protein